MFMQPKVFLLPVKNLPAARAEMNAFLRSHRVLAVGGRAQGYVRMNRWFLKMDIRKYFDSIHQATLRVLLGRKFKDRLLGVFDCIVSIYHTILSCALPIGNLTSQHFANYYLSPLDRFLKETLGRWAAIHG